jgi:hypothetical protein
VVNLYLNLKFLPFYKPEVNVTNILHGCAFAWGTMCLSVAYLRGVPQASYKKLRSNCTSFFHVNSANYL